MASMAICVEVKMLLELLVFSALRIHVTPLDMNGKI